MGQDTTGIQKHIATDGTVSYRVRFDGNPDPRTGRRVQRMKTFRTKNEAVSFRRQQLTDKDRGTAVDPSKLTVGEYMRRWLESTKRPSINATTYDSYYSLIEHRIIPNIGTIPLQRLTALHVQELYTTLLHAERLQKPSEKATTPSRAPRRGLTLSNRTVRYTATILKQALRHAVAMRLVPLNVAADAKAPSAVRPTIETWTAEEAKAFLAAARDDSYGAIWQVALQTGLRKGELLALRWCDLDLEGSKLSVRQNLTETRAGIQFGEPKTKAGRRTIDLSPQCVAALKAHRERQAQTPIPMDAGKRDTRLVFVSASGTPIDQRNLTHRLDTLGARAGVRRVTFHAMRHTHATLLLLGGVNIKAVSARLGHASIQITLDTYAHVLPQMEEQAANVIGLALEIGA